MSENYPFFVPRANLEKFALSSTVLKILSFAKIEIFTLFALKSRASRFRYFKLFYSEFIVFAHSGKTFAAKILLGNKSYHQKVWSDFNLFFCIFEWWCFKCAGVILDFQRARNKIHRFHTTTLTQYTLSEGYACDPFQSLPMQFWAFHFSSFFQNDRRSADMHKIWQLLKSKFSSSN